MFVCDNPECKTWLHTDCVIDDILTKTYKRLMNDDGATGKKPKAKGKRIWKGIFEAEVEPDEFDKPPTVEITDLRRKRMPWKERISCLKCGSLLENHNQALSNGGEAQASDEADQDSIVYIERAAES